MNEMTLVNGHCAIHLHWNLDLPFIFTLDIGEVSPEYSFGLMDIEYRGFAHEAGTQGFSSAKLVRVSKSE